MMQDASNANLLNTAIIAHKSGDYFQAEAIYREILDNDPECVQALHSLASLSLTLEQPSIAIPLLKKAIALDGNNPNLLYNLGLAYQQYKDIESAIYYYKLALALKPDFSLAHNNIGVAYQHLGRLDHANAHLEKALEYSPEYVDAYYNFSQSHKFSFKDQPTIKKIESLINLNRDNIDGAIKLNFSLGKIYGDLKISEQSFHYYQQGNRLKNAKFNTSQFKQYINNIIHNYSKAFVESHRNIPISAQRRFIFVIGMPRSGTTLIEQILASHSNVQSAGESGFVGDIVDDLSNLIQSEKTYPACIQDITSDKLLHVSSSLNTQIDNLPYSCNVITDKSPINFLHIGLMMLLFPKSIVVQTSRNPIDTCLSCYFQNFERQHQYSYDLKNLAFFYNQYSHLMSHWKSIFQDRIYEVFYENLVKNQKEETQKLIEACHLEWDEKCLHFYESDTVVSSASKWQIRRPIYQSSVNKWKQYKSYIGELIDNLDIDKSDI